MKKVALIGASGFVGTVILNELMRGMKWLLQSFTERPRFYRGLFYL